MEINNMVSCGTFSISGARTKSITANLSGETPETSQTESESIWREMALKYDLHSITTEQTEKLSQELYNAGEISLFDHAILSFDPDRFSCGSGFLTQADGTGHRDLLSEYEARIDLDEKTGNSQALVNHKRILEYLARLDEAESNLVYITA